MTSSLSIALERVRNSPRLTPSEKETRCAEIRAKHNAYNRAWIAKRRASDPSFADRQRAQAREWKARRLADPEARAEHNEYERKRQARRAEEKRTAQEKRERKNARDRAQRAEDKAKLEAEYEAKRAAGVSAKAAGAVDEARLERQLGELHLAHRVRQDVRTYIERVRLDASVGMIGERLAKRWLAELRKREAILTTEVRALRAAVGLPPELDAERRAKRPNAGGLSGSSIMRRAAAQQTDQLTNSENGA